MRTLEGSLRVSLLNDGGAIRFGSPGQGAHLIDLLDKYLTHSEAGTALCQTDAETPITDAVPRPASWVDMQDTYSTLLALLQEQPLKLQRLRAFRKSFRCDAPATMSGSLTALNALNRRLGGGDACLLVCTSLNAWLDDLEETAKDEMICVRIGLVSPSKKEVRTTTY